jgi:hypothetical protein
LTKRTISVVVKSVLSRNYSHSTQPVLTSPTPQLPPPASFPPPFAAESPRPPVSRAPSSAQMSPHAIQFPASKSDTIVFASSQSMYPRNLVSMSMRRTGYLHILRRRAHLQIFFAQLRLRSLAFRYSRHRRLKARSTELGQTCMRETGIVDTSSGISGVS